VILIGLIGAVGLALIGLVVIIDGGTDHPGPQVVFESHMQAVADEDWAYAHLFLADDCLVTADDLKRLWAERDYVPNEWRVDKAFIEDDEALLWLPVHDLQYMYKVDGDWKVSCEGGP
jgi:hypothetical protein